MSEPRLMLFDTASMYFRAFHALPTSIKSQDGRPVNAVRGLLDFIARFIAEYSPTHVACCWDESWRPAWRVELIPSYKAHRVAHDDVETVPDELDAQVPLIREVLAALGLPVVGARGYEADDIIGTLARRSRTPCDVVTGDRDLFQVVDDGRAVRVLYLGRGVANHDRVDAAWVLAKYGVAPSQYVDFAVLRGDPSDGLPGVPGIGDKTAAALVRSYGDLDGIVAAAQSDRLTPRIALSLRASIDYLAAAGEVVAVATDVGLPDLPLELPHAPVDPDAFSRLGTELALGGSADRILAALRR
jgi:5'-3' exonuclease